MDTDKKPTPPLPVIYLLSADRCIKGWTRDKPWALAWCRLSPEKRQYNEIKRLDRPKNGILPAAPPTGVTNASADAAAKPVPIYNRLHILEIHFDGGCRPTNPGNRYGSFRLEIRPVMAKKRVIFQNERIAFGEGTNNEAEFLALMAGLDFTLKWAAQDGRVPAHFRVKLVTDSMIVQGRMSGKNTARKTEPQQRMAALAAAALAKCAHFGGHEIEWRPRKHNVEIFGH